MSSYTSEQIKTCIKIALMCLELDWKKRPTIAEVAAELNKFDIAESSLTSEVRIFGSVVGQYGMTRLYHLPYHVISICLFVYSFL